MLTSADVNILAGKILVVYIDTAYSGCFCLATTDGSLVNL